MFLWQFIFKSDGFIKSPHLHFWYFIYLSGGASLYLWQHGSVDRTAERKRSFSEKLGTCISGHGHSLADFSLKKESWTWDPGVRDEESECIFVQSCGWSNSRIFWEVNREKYTTELRSTTLQGVTILMKTDRVWRDLLTTKVGSVRSLSRTVNILKNKMSPK